MLVVKWKVPGIAIDEMPHGASRIGALTSDDPHWIDAPLRLLSPFVKASIEHGLRWVGFEPNSEGVWRSSQAIIGCCLLETVNDPEPYRLRRQKLPRRTLRTGAFPHTAGTVIP